MNGLIYEISDSNNITCGSIGCVREIGAPSGVKAKKRNKKTNDWQTVTLVALLNGIRWNLSISKQVIQTPLTASFQINTRKRGKRIKTAITGGANISTLWTGASHAVYSPSVCSFQLNSLRFFFVLLFSRRSQKCLANNLFQQFSGRAFWSAIHRVYVHWAWQK